MTGLYILFDNFNTGLFEDTTQHFFKNSIINRIRTANNIQSALFAMLGIFLALPFSFDKPLHRLVVNSPSNRNTCFQLF